MDLKNIYPKRSPWTHKGEHGYVLIIAGSKRYSGSPVFNAISSLRTGADLVTCIGVKRAMDIAGSFSPDMITHPLDGDYLTPDHVPFILDLAKDFNSVILGCGLGRKKETLEAIREFIKNLTIPCVIDADGIRALARGVDIIKERKVVLTPHVAEFKILSGQEVKPDTKDRLRKVKEEAASLGCVILLKGHVDIISDGQRVALNKTGSSFMTKGGFGDTLSGILGALLARGIEPYKAALASAFINGKAGELACKEYGEGVLASDIFEFIPQVIKKYI